MRSTILLFCFQTALLGQILPTIPSNVFRISIGANMSDSKWNINNNQFSMTGIGRSYFDNMTHNDSVRFSSDHDLYHNGSTYIDSVNTIQEWMTNFNLNHGFSLPVFEAQNIDTSKAMSPNGQFSEVRERTVKGRYVHIDYGMSNEITLSASVPILDSYVIDQSYSKVSIDKIDGAQILVDYHQNAKQEFNTFINSNNFLNLRRGLKDTLQAIYDMFYTNNGQYSVKWAFHSQDDPINNLLVDQGFMPPGIDKDSVELSDLVSYYYPDQREGKGIDDVKIGATILLSGTPSWASDGKGDAIYGQLFVTIPYGRTLSQFLDVGRKQFSEARIGSGVSRWLVGFYGSKMIESNHFRRVYMQTQIKFSTTTTLNTPVELFSGGHTHPDSILSLIGNTYKYDMGTGLIINVGAELERFKNRLRLQGEILASFKGKDNYISKNPYWDLWMEEYSGNSPFYNKVDLRLELWFLNSLSKYRFGPLPFDLCAGFNTTLASNNTYAGWNAFAGITTYYQGW
ncbi:MAG: hypothetical protein QF780_08670 [Candidatus Marinimicrobia bacterium]|nr:hypothetical protein [Candidatus Neomarinimicrobiota bacterium]